MKEKKEEILETIKKKKSDERKSTGRDENKVPLCFFSFADILDIMLMTLGCSGAMITGLAPPLMISILGQIINTTFGGSSDPSNIVSDVSKVTLMSVYLIASFFQVSCWMVTGKRQAARIRGLYLKTILKQDNTFFDTETTTEEVIERMSRDTILIQDAIGEKVGKTIQLFSTFFGCLMIAFLNGWLLALVLVCCIPFLAAASGDDLTISSSKLPSREQIPYANEAWNIVKQTIRTIRKVASFTGEKAAIEKYNRSIAIAYASAVMQDLASGFGIGGVLLILYSSYGVAVWFASKLIIEKGYNGGQVVNVMFAIMACGMSLADALSSIKAICPGLSAAYKMIQAIKRKQLIDSNVM